MSQIKLVHTGGNAVIIAAPSSNPASDRTLTLPSDADGTVLSSASTLDATKLSGNLPALNGSALTNISGGKILQVVEAASSTTVSTSAGEVDLITVSITPASSSNKVMVFVTFSGQAEPGTNSKVWIQVYRGTSSGTQIMSLKQGSGDAQYRSVHVSGQKLDSPSTASAQTYTVTLARLSGGTNTVTSDGNPYQVQAMEVAA